jgi:hypothetical protein
MTNHFVEQCMDDRIHRAIMGRGRCRPMSMRGRVDLHDERGFLLAQPFSTRLVRDIAVQRDSLVRAEARIARIIHTNHWACDATPEHP